MVRIEVSVCLCLRGDWRPGILAPEGLRQGKPFLFVVFLSALLILGLTAGGLPLSAPSRA